MIPPAFSSIAIFREEFTGGRRGKNSLHDRRGHLIRDELMHIVRILFVAIRWTGTVLPALTLVFQNVFDLA